MHTVGALNDVRSVDCDPVKVKAPVERPYVIPLKPTPDGGKSNVLVMPAPGRVDQLDDVRVVECERVQVGQPNRRPIQLPLSLRPKTVKSVNAETRLPRGRKT